MKKGFVFVLGVFVTCLFIPTLSKASEFNFAVQARLPDNQINKDVSYFDIKMNPGVQQTLKLDLRNDTDRPVTVDVAIASATTNLNGVVEYSPNDLKAAPSLKCDLSKQVTAPPQVTIPAKGTSELDLQAQMPTASFEGVMAGGVTLKEHKATAKDNSEGKGVAIKNEFSYVVGLVMRQNEKIVAPDLTLSKVTPTQVNARNVIMADMENPTATFINKVAVDGTVTKKDSSKVLYKINKDNLQIAPNTLFDFPIPLSGKALQPGTYTAHLDVYGNLSDRGIELRKMGDKTQKYLNHWHFTKEFTVKAAVAKDLNKKDVSIKSDTSQRWLYILLAIVALLLLLVLLLLVLILKRKKTTPR